MKKGSRTKEPNAEVLTACLQWNQCWRADPEKKAREHLALCLDSRCALHCAPVHVLHCRLLETYQQIPGSLLRGSVYRGRDDIWECLLERCGASHMFLWGWSGPARSSPSLRPTSETQRSRTDRVRASTEERAQLGVVDSSSPAVCSWCALVRAAAGLSWRSPAGGRRGPAESGACCPRWSLSSPVGGSKHHTNWPQASRAT